MFAAVAVVLAATVVVAWSRTGRDGQAKSAAPAAASSDDVPSPVVRVVGNPIEVAVEPSQPFAAAVPGVGHLSAPAGAFASAGRVIVQPLQANAPDGSLVTLGGTGVDVSFDGTTLTAPITMTFDDPATGGHLPANAVPVVLHQRAPGNAWDVRTAANDSGTPQLSTTDFSPNLFGWITLPDWVKEMGDSIADFATLRTDPRPCANNPPQWSSVANRTTLVHLCAISNTEPTSKIPRAELQVQSNRRFFEWVSVPAGADYVWVADEQDWFRAALSKLTGRDRNREVLLAGNGWLTAGYRQPAQREAKEFNASIDYYSAGFSVGSSILGLDPRDNVQGSLIIIATCLDTLRTFPSWDSAKDFIKCFIEESLSNLANPEKAFSQALDLFGEAGYAKEAEQSLRKALSRLQFLGRLIKIIGIVNVIRYTYGQLPDIYAQWGTTQPGRFTLTLAGSAPPLDGDRLRALGACRSRCIISSKLDFDHPTWGRCTIVTTKAADTATVDANIAVVDAAGTLRWHHWGGGWPELALAEPARDRTGHIFLNYNPGRYNGVVILGPSKAGFDTYDSLPPPDDYRSRFYSSDLRDVDGDGIYEVDSAINDCDPTCAEGTVNHTIYHWNGTTYAPR